MNKLFDLKLSRSAFARLTGLVILSVLIVSSLFLTGRSARGTEESASASPVPLTALETAAPENVSVYIVGNVASPGVYSVERGSLLSDLLEMCGGLTDEADAERVNMVYRIDKNCMISIGSDGDGESMYPDSMLYPEGSSEGTGLVNINTASLQELCTLPGIGTATAKKIISYRESNPFMSIEELMNVSGIGTARFEAIKDLIST